MTVAAADLATALRSKKPILLPDDPLRSNIKQLCDIFQSPVQEIAVKNPKPLLDDLDDATESLNIPSPAPLPRVIDNNNPDAKVTNKISKETTEPSPRVETNPTAPQVNTPTRTEHKNKLCGIPSTSSKNNERPSFHRHPTLLKIAKAASSLQLEEAQVKQNKPVTIHLDSNIVNPPN